jgi:hypothetical protein
VQAKGVKVLANRRRRSRGVLSWRIGGRRPGIPLWAFALVVAMIGVAAGQAGSERVNALLAGFLLMPGEFRTITITNPTNQPTNPLGMLVTDTGVEVKADTDFAVKTNKVPLSYADQLLAAMLKGAGGSASAPKPTKRPPATPRRFRLHRQ